MKKFLVLGLLCVATLSVQAQKGPLTDEQTALKKEMVAKYDANKDGKLDKDELSKMTDDEKAKWKKVFPHHAKKDSDASTNAAPAAPKAN